MLSITNVDKLAIRLESKLKLFAINELAKKSGFVKRKAKKIKPLQFLLGFFFVMLSTGKSLSSLATSVGLISGCTISKQAIDKRFTSKLVLFLEYILASVLANRVIVQSKSLLDKLSSFFNNIYVQDSTTIHLNRKLADHFPGSTNQTGKKSATLKIQAVLELLSEQFCHFSLSPFTKNDQSAAPDILSLLRPGDLLMRDLGYFTLSVLNQITKIGAYYISRFRHGVTVFEIDGKTEISLLSLLRKYGHLDMMVILGKKVQVKARIIAIPVSEQEAARRRRLARNHHDRRRNPGKEHLALLGWDIFVLNIYDNAIEPKIIAELYQLRFHIEIVFKSWKSHFHITNVPNANVYRVLSHVYAMLIFIAIFQTYVYARLFFERKRKTFNQLSLLKLSKFFKEQIWAIVLFFSNPEYVENQIYYHCNYQYRKDQINYCQKKSILG
jgi:hypothetical protein